MQTSNATDIPHACQLCRSKRCQDLYWEDCIIFPDIFEVPFNCPLRVDDENTFKRELKNLSDYKVSRIFGNIVFKYNWDIRCNDEIEHLVLHFRRSKCTMIAKWQNPNYKPWTLFGFWAHKFTGMGPVLPKKESKENITAAENEETVIPEPKPIKITASGMEHLDEQLQKDKYRKIADGDKIKLMAEVDGAGENESMKFELYYYTNDWDSIHFATTHGKITNGIGSAEWTVDLSKPRKAAANFDIKHEPVVRGKYGPVCKLELRQPGGVLIEADTIIDGHMHIQTGASAPLPLIWAQDWKVQLIKPSRFFLDGASPHMYPEGGKVQRQSTEQIGAQAVSENREAYTTHTNIPLAHAYAKAKELFTPMAAQTMDMDYAQLAGFPPHSKTIYHEGRFKKLTSVPNVPPIIEVDGVYYYERSDGRAAENAGVLNDVSHEKPEKGWVFKKYKAQIDGTIETVKKAPWIILPMFHYEPRRWYKESEGEQDDKNWKFGPWSLPFDAVATSQNSGIFIGFKMYPPLGYKPLDPRLPHLDKFYARCEAEGIPILAHCSPGGMTTHEAKYYHEFDRADLTKQPDRVVSCSYDPYTPMGYFFDEYVHPKNWRPVLMKYPKLKLCLAHFGGSEWGNTGLSSDWIKEIIKLCDPNIVQGRNAMGRQIHFENVYTDMSCLPLDNGTVQKNMKEFFKAMGNKDCWYRHMRNKIIFGTDWYLTLLTQDKAPYYSFCESFYNICEAANDVYKTFWYRFSLVNPATFYGLDNHEMINNMKTALKIIIDNKETMPLFQRGYERMKAIKSQVDRIKKELSKVP